METQSITQQPSLAPLEVAPLVAPEHAATTLPDVAERTVFAVGPQEAIGATAVGRIPDSTDGTSFTRHRASVEAEIINTPQSPQGPAVVQAMFRRARPL